MLGIFDSGLGGLTVVRQVEKAMPSAGYVYLGDTARLPYGTKSPEIIERYALQALRFLRAHNASVPVVACHTVSSLLFSRKSAYKRAARLFGRSDVFEVVTPAINAAKAATCNKRVGVLGTSATIRSGAYQRGLSGYRVFPVAASVLVAFAEEGWASRRRETEPVLRQLLRPLQREKVDTVVLACTHFPLFEDHIRDIMGSAAAIVDPGKELAEALASQDLARRGAKRFFVTDISPDFSERASHFLRRTIRARTVHL